MIVVDTNAVVALFIPTTATEAAETMWRRDPHWCAPPLLFSELCNVLIGQVRRCGLSLGDAAEIANESDSRIRWLPRPSGAAILAAAHTGGLTAYDAEFVAAAEAADLKLLTADKAVLRAFPDLCVPLSEAV